MSSIFLSGTSLMVRNLLHCLIVGKSSRVCFLLNFLCFSFRLRSFCPKSFSLFYAKSKNKLHPTRLSLLSLLSSLCTTSQPSAFVVLQQAGAARRKSWGFNDFEFNPISTSVFSGFRALRIPGRLCLD